MVWEELLCLILISNCVITWSVASYCWGSQLILIVERYLSQCPSVSIFWQVLFGQTLLCVIWEIVIVKLDQAVRCRNFGAAFTIVVFLQISFTWVVFNLLKTSLVDHMHVCLIFILLEFELALALIILEVQLFIAVLTSKLRCMILLVDEGGIFTINL
jgi:hypothetical protein